MIFLYTFNADGTIRHKYDLPDSDAVAQYSSAMSQDSISITSTESYDIRNIYYKGGIIKVIPPKPGDGYIFNILTDSWVQDTVLQWTIVKDTRDTLLSASDWVIVKAFDTGTTVPVSWQEYRQALRDVTKQPDPFNIVWPIKPV